MKCLCRHRGAVEVQELGSRRKLMISTTLRALNPRERHATPCVAGYGWPPGPVWTTRKILFPAGLHPRNVQPITSRFVYRVTAVIYGDN